MLAEFFFEKIDLWLENRYQTDVIIFLFYFFAQPYNLATETTRESLPVWPKKKTSLKPEDRKSDKDKKKRKE